MNKRIVTLLLIAIAIVGVQGVMAVPQYLAAFQTLYTDGSCATCHINPAGGGPRNTYGMLFENQSTFSGIENIGLPNFTSDTIAALKSAGPAPGTMPLNDTIPPVINSVILDNTTPNTGQDIMVIVNATDDVGVVNVTANGTELTHQSGDIWNGSIIAEEGNHTVDVMAFDAAGNNATDNSTNYSATTIAFMGKPLNITKLTPNSPLTSIFEQAQTFTADISQNASVEWTLDGNIVQTNDNVTKASYTNTNASMGQHVLMVNASNMNGSDSFSWDWNVTTSTTTSLGNSSIMGVVFNDKNKDEKKEKGEKGISGLKIMLTGMIDDTNILMTTVSDSNGKYKFTNLSAGHYKVKLVLRKGLKATTHVTRRVKLDANEIDKINFGVHK